MKKLILRCGYCPGDVVMLTAAVRDLHRCYPGRFLTDVRTFCDELWEHNPYLTRLNDEDQEAELIDCTYPLINRCDHTPYHCLHGFVEFLNQRLRLAIKPTAFRGDIHLSEQEKVWYSQVHEVTGRRIPFWLIAAGGKYDITIKWWEAARYQEVVDRLRGRVQFVQVGSYGNHHPKLNGVIDLRGRTSLRELVRLVYHAEGVLCPVTSLMHLAAAVETRNRQPDYRPCVVIAGGREPAHWEAYPNHQFLHSNGALPCCLNGGCWRDRTEPLRDGDVRDRPNRRCVDVHHGLPRCMDLITAEEVVSRVEKYYNGGTLKYLTPAQAKAAKRGVDATAGSPFDQQALHRHSAGLACERFIRSIPPYPDGFRGRGIVICGGGVRYFTNAWVCINLLRRHGCRLPIELWHLGKEELDVSMKALVEPLGVTCVDAFKVRKKYPVRRLAGWGLKAYALLHASFEEVLSLDADNVPVRAPDYLFDNPEFKRQGAIFWPDCESCRNPKAKPVWRSCGLRPPDEPEFESGQMLLNKRHGWAALCLAMWFNENSDFYYQYLHGDKETFHVAFRMLKHSYALVREPAYRLAGILCQHDFEGRRLFQHRINNNKWDLFLPNKRVRGFWFEQECRRLLQNLRRRWDGRVPGSRKHRSQRDRANP